MNPASYQRAPPFLSDADVDFSSPDPSTSSTTFSTSDFSIPTSSGSHPQTPYSSSFTAQPGSYQNSPLGSDISHFDQHPPASSPNPAQNSPYVNQSSNDDFNFDIPVFPPDEYDPNDYDAQGSSLLFNTDFVTSLDSIEAQQQQFSSPSPSASSVGSDNPGISVIPAEQSMQSYGSPNYHGSPASSNGGDDFHLQSLQQRSRASSVSSSHKANNSLDYSTLGMEHVNLDSTSSWMQQQQGTSNAQSPPHIVIPDTSGSRQGQSSPTIGSNAMSNMGHGALRNPQLDLDGPGIQVVPATPISAGNGNAAHGGMNHFSHLMRQQGE